MFMNVCVCVWCEKRTGPLKTLSPKNRPKREIRQPARFLCTRKWFSNSCKSLYDSEGFIILVANCTLCALRVSLFYFSLSLTSRNPPKDFHFFLRRFARLTKLWKQLGLHSEKAFSPPPTQTFHLGRGVVGVGWGIFLYYMI